MKLSEKIQEALREQQEINLSDPAVQKRLAAQWGYVPAGAQPTPSFPEGWLRAIDEALVVAHIGVANESDTYEQAREKLDNLIGFHVDVATDPAVNGGWKLVSINPSKTFYQCFSAYDGTSYSNPFDYDDFVKDWRAALESAPEAEL